FVRGARLRLLSRAGRGEGRARRQGSVRLFGALSLPVVRRAARRACLRRRQDAPSHLDVVMRDAEEERKRRQRKRSLAIAWILFALVVLFFVVTIVRLGGHVADRPI